jgi:hypothetical protein
MNLRFPRYLVAKTGFATDHVVADPKLEQPQPGDIIPLDKIVDLTKNLAPDGRLTWTPPAGRWTILRLGHTPTGIKISPAPHGGEGLECDKMSRAAADFHYDHFMAPLLKELGPELRKALACQHVDSYEAGWQNWTPKFPQEFQSRRSYDLVKYLPAVTGRIVGDMPTTDKFLWDFRRTIGDLYADCHYGRLAERSHQDGLGFSTEPYGGPFEFVQVGTRADFPMIEFWIPTNSEARKAAFHGVFAGHLAGRRIIGAESFTSGPPEEKWNAHPFSLKAMGDYISTSGVNRFVIHVFAHQPFVDEHLEPGLTCAGNGIHFDRCNTWFSQGHAWVEYLTRSQALLQQGEHVADAIYFQGDDSPHWTGPFQPELPEGYDFDGCGGETLGQLAVHDGFLRLPHGKSYGYLVLPHDGRMKLKSLERIAELLRAGATIVGPGEVGGVALASRYAHSLVCSNYLVNACVTSGVAIPKLDQPRQPPVPPLERDKMYIALNLSDGDNQNCWLAFYKDRCFLQERFGDFPLAFGMGPPILDLQPARAQWYFEHAGGKIEFLADVSGVGYMHPGGYGSAFTEAQLALDGFLDWTRRHMGRLGMQTLRPEQPGNDTLARYAQQIPAMHSIFADMGRYSGRSGIEHLTYALPTGIPVFHAVTSWRYGKTGMLREIREQVGKIRPAFVNAIVHCWTFNDLDILVGIYDARDKDMVFVTPTQLAELYRRAKQ